MGRMAEDQHDKRRLRRNLMETGQTVLRSLTHGRRINRQATSGQRLEIKKANQQRTRGDIVFLSRRGKNGWSLGDIPTMKQIEHRTIADTLRIWQIRRCRLTFVQKFETCKTYNEVRN